jgi:hypothetical protein
MPGPGLEEFGFIDLLRDTNRDLVIATASSAGLSEGDRSALKKRQFPDRRPL